jgi:hypothetical protein
MDDPGVCLVPDAAPAVFGGQSLPDQSHQSAAHADLHAHANKSTHQHANAHAHPDAHADLHGYADPCAYQHANAHTHPDAHTNKGRNICPNINSRTYCEAHSHTYAYRAGHPDSDFQAKYHTSSQAPTGMQMGVGLVEMLVRLTA